MVIPLYHVWLNSWTLRENLKSSGCRLSGSPRRCARKVVEKLRNAVTEGILRPGERVVERALCAQLDVSRPLLREAVRQLEAEGLIENVPYRGPVVRELTLEDAGELFDMCELVEGLCARYFAMRGEAEDADRLDAALDLHEKALLIGKPEEVRRAKAAYYEAFIAGSKSEMVQTTGEGGSMPG